MKREREIRMRESCKLNGDGEYGEAGGGEGGARKVLALAIYSEWVSCDKYRAATNGMASTGTKSPLSVLNSSLS